ncbi:hypothetical protein G9A89_020852 [Geosiphon pyriformis]|nr:hypothetical protein G9A89_020852 [Geosiphon pyriformis]
MQSLKVNSSLWPSLKSLEHANLHHNLSQEFIPGAGPDFYPSTLLNTRAVNGKSKGLIDLKQDIAFYRELKVMAYFSNHIYCMKNEQLGKKVPSGRLKGPELTKFQWATRGNQLTAYKVEGIKSHNLILVEKDWQDDFLAVRESLFGTIMDGLVLSLKHKWPIQFILFVGHAIGGAYATLAGLSWKIELSLMDGFGKIPTFRFSDFKISTTTFGAPRVGNAVFARLREYWILPRSCECSTEENNGQYSLYECKGFDYASQDWKYYEVSPESLFPDGIMSGENEECNAGQSIDNVPGDYIHKGPYFGVRMNDCSPNNHLDLDI